MKTRIVAIGIFLVLLVGCNNSSIPTNNTPIAEPINGDATKAQFESPVATPTLKVINTEETSTQMIIPDLNDVQEGKDWKGHTNTVKLVEKDGAPAIEIDKEDYNVIWLDGFEFTNGTIEFDVKGKSEPPQGSFIGVAFRVVDDAVYDSIYFRPFNFGATDPDRRSHAVQYQSFPDWDWYKLRTEKTGQYEKPIDPAPDGDMWFHVKVVIDERNIKVYVNNATEPALNVMELSDRTGGSVGIYCFGYGVVANLQVTPTP